MKRGFILILVFLPISVFAADLYLSPSNINVKVNQNFSLNVYVSSPDQEINAVSGYLSFPKDLISVNSISLSGSLVKFWAIQPYFKNSEGTIGFEGVIFNPAFKGSQGKILTINFKAKKSGSGKIDFTSGSILANDGEGTNVLENLRGASFNIQGVEEETTYIPSPKIYSSTHPDQNKWYSNKLAKLEWNVPSGIDEVKTLLGQRSDAYPQISYVPPISSKEIEIPYDGTWYFSAQFCNEYGCSGISRYKLNIDTTPPELNLREIQRDDLTDPRIKIYVDYKDNLSGIDKIVVSFNNKEEIWQDDGTHIYQPKNLEPGNYKFVFKVYDKAGNKSESSLETVIKLLEPPIITEYTKEVNFGEPVVIKGKAKYQNIDVYVYLIHERGVQVINNTKIKENGEFDLIAQNVNAGNYKGYAILADSIGRKSLPSEEIYLTVKFPYVINLWGVSFNIFYLIALFLILLLILLGLVLHYLYSLKWLKEAIEKEAEDVHISIDKFINYLHNRYEEQIKILQEAKNKRELTEEEMKILKELEEKLEKIKRYIHKEIKDLKDLAE